MEKCISCVRFIHYMNKKKWTVLKQIKCCEMSDYFFVFDFIEMSATFVAGKCS